MCGIIIEILYRGDSILKDEKLLRRIHNRGPDCNSRTEVDVGDGTKVIFCGAVLWMQGPSTTHQPIESEHGILLYNGDIFDATWDNSFSDTQLIMNKLCHCKSMEQIIQALKTLKGPFSIIYYEKMTKKLIFARDRIGRNSLLFHRSDHSVVISNVLGRKYKCIEIPAAHIQIMNIVTKEISLFPWTECKNIETYPLDKWLNNLEGLQSLLDEEFSLEMTATEKLVDKDNIIIYIENQVKELKCKITLMNKLLENEIIQKTVLKLTNLLEQSVKIRLDTQPQKCKLCLYKESVCDHCTVGILFSGGLDCTILAFLANKYLGQEQSIELLNVAFKKELNGNYDVPDRLTGKQSFEELKKLCPSRRWIFKEINVPKEELEFYQKSVIADLVYPRQSILDESLGSAFWFAARGKDEDSTSLSRVLLLGSGADELFGGYTRHRNSYKRRGWSGLYKELLLDWKRISFRNLARDNRVICDHGRQPRMPYLDEDFTNYVLKLDPWLKCFPSESLGQGVGDKLMLRLVALNLGLSDVVTFPKRALQFGSRIANKKEKGSDISTTFMDMKLND